MQWLDLLDYFHVRIPLGAIPITNKKTGDVSWRRHPLSGFPDLLGVLKKHRGRMFVIECKSTYGRVQSHQKDWHRELKDAGVVVIVANSLHTAVDEIRKAESDESYLGNAS